jgi:hypothetical protein
MCLNFSRRCLGNINLRLELENYTDSVDYLSSILYSNTQNC